MPPANPRRHDLYAGIHKALRLHCFETLAALGHAGHDTLPQACQQVEQLLAMLERHAAHEDAFLHPALEAAQPGSAHSAAVEHGDQRAELRDLSEQAQALRQRPDTQAQQRLYRTLALFVAENLRHMHHEETVHNALLWAHYRDQDLIAIEQDLVASLSEAEKAELMPLFLRALDPTELLAMQQPAAQAEPAHAA